MPARPVVQAQLDSSPQLGASAVHVGALFAALRIAARSPDRQAAQDRRVVRTHRGNPGMTSGTSLPTTTLGAARPVKLARWRRCSLFGAPRRTQPSARRTDVASPQAESVGSPPLTAQISHLLALPRRTSASGYVAYISARRASTYAIGRPDWITASSLA